MTARLDGVLAVAGIAAALEVVEEAVGPRHQRAEVRVGCVDELVGVAREPVERVHVRSLGPREQPGREVVGAAVRCVQPTALS